MSEVKKTILICEDDPVVNDLYTSHFISAGYNVQSVATGDKVVPAMCEHKPDIVILDMIMPLKMGYEVLEEIKFGSGDACKDVPIVLLSNLSQPEVVDKAKGLGVVDYFVKASITPRELEEKIQQYLY